MMAELRYPCLVLDHDDTVTDSTRTVHYPAFLDAMAQLRPDDPRTVTLEDYFRLNFDPGFLSLCRDILKFDDAEMEREYEIWQSWATRIVPDVFPGMARIIRRQKALGGRVCVISHSVDTNIRRDYRENGLPEPDLVFGWERPAEQRKPHPWPLQEIVRQLGFAPSPMLMVDDLKPGLDMANAAGVPFAAALWAHHIPEIHAHMRRNASLCFDEPEALERYLFDGAGA